MFLLVVVEACFLITPPREYPKEFRIGPIYAGGNPKGALPPLCRRGGGVHRGGTPSKGSLPYAVFGLLFVRTKSNPGFGGGAPDSIEKKMEYSRRPENKNKLFCSSRSSRGKICG